MKGGWIVFSFVGLVIVPGHDPASTFEVGQPLVRAEAFEQSRLQQATARCGFRVGHNNEEPGSLVFEVRRQGASVSGEFQFAAEDHDHGHAPYPATVLRLHAITNLTFEGSTVHIEGHGYLNDHHVHVKATAYDGTVDKLPDRFKLECFHDSQVIYTIEREVRTGRIRVRP